MMIHMKSTKAQTSMTSTITTIIINFKIMIIITMMTSTNITTTTIMILTTTTGMMKKATLVMKTCMSTNSIYTDRGLINTTNIIYLQTRLIQLSLAKMRMMKNMHGPDHNRVRKTSDQYQPTLFLHTLITMLQPTHVLAMATITPLIMDKILVIIMAIMTFTTMMMT